MSVGAQRFPKTDVKATPPGIFHYECDEGRIEGKFMGCEGTKPNRMCRHCITQPMWVEAHLALIGNITHTYGTSNITFFLSCGGMSPRMCNDTKAAAAAAKAIGIRAQFLNISGGGDATGNRTRTGVACNAMWAYVFMHACACIHTCMHTRACTRVRMRVSTRMDGWLAGWVDGWVDGWMDGWMEWMDGWMDGWVGICPCMYVLTCMCL